MTIVNERGLHARAAAKFTRIAGFFDAEIEVTRKDVTVPADSMLGLMMLGAAMGSELELRASGVEAAAALEALAVLVADGFGEHGKEEESE